MSCDPSRPLTFEAVSVLLQRAQNLVNYIFIVKEIIHLIVERGSTTSDNFSMTISTSLGHATHAANNIVQERG